MCVLGSGSGLRLGLGVEVPGPHTFGRELPDKRVGVTVTVTVKLRVKRGSRLGLMRRLGSRAAVGLGMRLGCG